MSDPRPALWRRALAGFLLALPALVRLALVLFALGLLWQGARMIYEPAGYLVVGALLWIELARRPVDRSGGAGGD